MRLARTLGYGAGGYGAFMHLVSAATAAEAAVPIRVSFLAQDNTQVYPGGTLTGLFNSGGLVGEFAAGFLGSGVLGLLFGRGLIGELGSVPSYLGLAFQLALLGMLARLIWTRWHGGDAASAGALSPRQLADPYLRSRDDLHAGASSPPSDEPVAPAPTARQIRTSEMTGPRKCS